MIMYPNFTSDIKFTIIKSISRTNSPYLKVHYHLIKRQAGVFRIQNKKIKHMSSQHDDGLLNFQHAALRYCHQVCYQNKYY